METIQKYKMGDVRDDGMVFIEYKWKRNNPEYWSTPEVYAKRLEKAKIKRLAWVKANKEKDKELQKSYRSKNKDKINKYYRDRRKTDSIYRSKQDVRNFIGASFKRRKFSKKNKTENILGCTYAEFFTHIESQFKNGMSWGNRSKWEIDHIIPLATAKTEEQILRLNHYTNLRPLWTIENRTKGSKILC